MDSLNIEIPESNENSIILDTETQIAILIKAISFISQNLSSEIIINLKNTHSAKIYEDTSNLNTLSANRLQCLLDEFKCKMCHKEFIEITTQCSHSFCIKCIQAHINSQNMSKILLNELSNYHNQESFKCPNCEAFLSSTDINKIFKNAEESIQIQEYPENSEPSLKKCPNCKNYRKENLLFQICQDNCLVCIKESILDKNILQCEKCQFSYKDNDLIEKKLICAKCHKDYFFIGDNMQVLCNDVILCLNCANSAIDKSMCFCSKHLLSLESKLEISRSLYKVCNICGEEHFYKIFPRKRCCNKKVCFHCLLNKSNCPECSSEVSARCKNEITKFFGQSLF